ncbi:MAG: ATP cone domain-containing protein [Nanoarchaeota archaeon]|nr:hypothetical protein [Nanoarchaeota archaeon]MBU1631709.1 hypothetical protein [Nanoarchaeota archaeon]MBU1876229.1 hypothetical protein [Nanoarchaeota archaeon]
MVTHVLKRNKKKQQFMPIKIRHSVEKAAKEAKLSSARVKQLVLDVAEPVIELAKKKKVVKSTDLRRAILGRLDRRTKKTSKAWRKFDIKRRS